MTAADPDLDWCVVDPTASGWPALAEREVHLWLVSLDEPPVALDVLAATLQPDERARAARFVFPHDQRRYACGRGLLRVLLARYAGRAPASLRFRYSAHGKPSLLDDDTESPLCFNLSHTQGHALLGVTRGQAIGVDLEGLRPVPEAEDIARSNFAASEFAAFVQRDAARRMHAFFACWTRKEAFVKAVGEGLSIPLDRFEVDFDAQGAQALCSIGGSSDAAREWTVRGWSVAQDLEAALAVRCADVTTKWFRLADRHPV